MSEKPRHVWDAIKAEFIKQRVDPTGLSLLGGIIPPLDGDAIGRAAIAAMRQPTPAMYDVSNTLEARYKQQLKSFEVTGFCWLIYQAMIDEALK